ncbi:MAG: helix-turn-helix domain-containing protein [bacterium]|nr:helix-turn-helix domain-containing protein [bacterium]
MTVKEIAETTGRSERTVRNWIHNVNDKHGEILNKFATEESADFTRDEVFKILKTGLGEQIAGVYIMNAYTQDIHQKSVPLTVEKKVDEEAIEKNVKKVLTQMLPEFYKPIVKAIKSLQCSIESKYTLKVEIPQTEFILPPVKTSKIIFTYNFLKKRQIFLLNACIYFSKESFVNIDDRVSMSYQKDGILIIKSPTGNKVTELPYGNGKVYVRFTLSKEELRIIPIDFSNINDKIVITGEKIPDGVFFKYSAATRETIKRINRGH